MDVTKMTTLPYMEAELFAESIIDQYRFYCGLCEYRTGRGSFYDCEMEAADHLDAEHPKERAEADAKVRAERERLRSHDLGDSL
jgi:hypothetical protein